MRSRPYRRECLYLHQGPGRGGVTSTRMRGFVANTDYDWFTYLRAIEPPIDEVNFWKPGSGTNFSALVPGEPLFFKLKAPRNAIAGFGYFAHFSRLPVSMVWQL